MGSNDEKIYNPHDYIEKDILTTNNVNYISLPKNWLKQIAFKMGIGIQKLKHSKVEVFLEYPDKSTEIRDGKPARIVIYFSEDEAPS